MHFTMQATEVITRVKNPSNIPAKIAPITLVAANVIAKRISENKIVPNIPIISVERAVQTHSLIPFSLAVVLTSSVNPRYTTAIPNTTHKNAGVKVIVALKVRKAVMIPIIMLDTTARTVQLGLAQQQFVLDI